MKVRTRSLRSHSSSTSRPCRRRAAAGPLPLLLESVWCCWLWKSPNGSRRPHHFYKPLDVPLRWGWSRGVLYCMRRRHHHLSTVPTNLDPKNGERSSQNTRRSPPTDEGQDPLRLYGPKATKTRRSAAAPAGGRRRSNCWGSRGCVFLSYFVVLSFFLAQKSLV
jgi:hypothetical protein